MNKSITHTMIRRRHSRRSTIDTAALGLCFLLSMLATLPNTTSALSHEPQSQSQSQFNHRTKRRRRQHEQHSNNNLQKQNKKSKICSVSGGLDIARLCSRNLQSIFQGAIDDVELIREYVAEAAHNQGIVGGMHSLEALNQTLDWQGRNFTSPMTTFGAGLGYVDDRSDRRIDRFVSLLNQPVTGSKETDLALIDSLSNLFPWIVDRKNSKDTWWLSHMADNRYQTLENQGDDSSTTSPSASRRLYQAAFIGTPGEAWLYYPPINKVFTGPLTAGDSTGGYYDSSKEEFVVPNLPQNNPDRLASFSKPYPDTVLTGMSLITALAPVYLPAQTDFQGNVYQEETYVASAGIDMSISSISTLLEDLESDLADHHEGSFAFVVDCRTFDMIIVSQSTVEKIYPTHTGMEESRVTYDKATGEVLDDRRNQPYLVSDTIFQSPLDLDNADWNSLFQDHVQPTLPGDREWTTMDITLTGDSDPTSFYAMIVNWDSVADWTFLMFTPKDEIDHSIQYRATPSTVDLTILEGSTVETEIELINDGTIDLEFSIEKLPSYMTLSHDSSYSNADLSENVTATYHVAAKDRLTLLVEANITSTTATSMNIIAFKVSADGYSDCFYENLLTVDLNVQVIREPNLNQLDDIRSYGFLLVGIIVISSVGCSMWVIRNSQQLIVRAAQPVFLHMMCIGILIMGMAIVPMGLDDSILTDHGCSIACMSVPWLLGMGFCITFSALFGKIWRINQIVNACKAYQRVNVSIYHVMIPFAVMFVMNATLLGLWTALDPVVWKRDYGYVSAATAVGGGIGGTTQQQQQQQHYHQAHPAPVMMNDFASTSNSSVGYCSISTSPISMACTIGLILVNFFALVLALVQLYRARGVSAEYSEGKYIAIAVGSMTQAILTGAPILAMVRYNPQVKFLINSTLVFVVSMSMLSLIFLPKICSRSHSFTDASTTRKSTSKARPISFSAGNRHSQYSDQNNRHNCRNCNCNHYPDDNGDYEVGVVPLSSLREIATNDGFDTEGHPQYNPKDPNDATLKDRPFLDEEGSNSATSYDDDLVTVDRAVDSANNNDDYIYEIDLKGEQPDEESTISSSLSPMHPPTTGQKRKSWFHPPSSNSNTLRPPVRPSGRIHSAGRGSLRTSLFSDLTDSSCYTIEEEDALSKVQSAFDLHTQSVTINHQTAPKMPVRRSLTTPPTSASSSLQLPSPPGRPASPSSSPRNGQHHHLPPKMPKRGAAMQLPNHHEASGRGGTCSKKMGRGMAGESTLQMPRRLPSTAVSEASRCSSALTFASDIDSDNEDDNVLMATAV